jgi:hypothetical protein
VSGATTAGESTLVVSPAAPEPEPEPQAAKAAIAKTNNSFFIVMSVY